MDKISRGIFKKQKSPVFAGQGTPGMAARRERYLCLNACYFLTGGVVGFVSALTAVFGAAFATVLAAVFTVLALAVFVGAFFFTAFLGAVFLTVVVFFSCCFFSSWPQVSFSQGLLLLMLPGLSAEVCWCRLLPKDHEFRSRAGYQPEAAQKPCPL